MRGPRQDRDRGQQAGSPIKSLHRTRAPLGATSMPRDFEARRDGAALPSPRPVDGHRSISLVRQGPCPLSQSLWQFVGRGRRFQPVQVALGSGRTGPGSCHLHGHKTAARPSCLAGTETVGEFGPVQARHRPFENGVRTMLLGCPERGVAIAGAHGISGAVSPTPDGLLSDGLRAFGSRAYQTFVYYNSRLERNHRNICLAVNG